MVSRFAFAAGIISVLVVPVASKTNQPPNVSLSAPSDGALFEAPASIVLSAAASDPDGPVADVSFYAGQTLIGRDSKKPYSATWSNVGAGSYVLTAVARDRAGAITTSAPRTITVTPPVSSLPPPDTATATFTPSIDDSIVVKYVLDVFPSTANPATATPAASQNLAKPLPVNGECSADISTTLATLPAGTYIATVTAVASSMTARSTPSAPFSILGTSSAPLAYRLDSLMVERSVSSEPTSSGVESEPHSEGTVWVTNASTNLIAAFDAATGDILGTAPVGLQPAGIAIPRGVGKVYVADEGSDTISVVAKASIARVATIALPRPLGRKPRSVSSSPDGSAVYIAEAGSNVVDVIDTATDRVSARFAAGQTGSAIRAAVADGTGQVVYALSRHDVPSMSMLAAIESATGRWLWAIPIDDQPGALAIAPDGRTAFVSIPAKSRIRLIDLYRRAVVGDVELGHAPESMRPSPDGGIVVTLHSDPTHVAALDGERNVRIISLAESRSGWSAAKDAGELWYLVVADAGDAEVIAIDSTSAAIARRFRFPGGGLPQSVVFEPR